MDHSVVLRGIGSASPLFDKSAKPIGMPNQGPWRGKSDISTKTVAKTNSRITILRYRTRRGSGCTPRPVLLKGGDVGHEGRVETSGNRLRHKVAAVGVIEALVGVEGREIFEELGMKI